MLNRDVVFPAFSGLRSFLVLSDGLARQASQSTHALPSVRRSGRRSEMSIGLSAALAWFLLLQPATADTVIMRNGDRLTGEVVRQEGSELIIRTEYAADTIALDRTQVKDVKLDTAAPVLLDDERLISVETITREDKLLRLETTADRQVMTVAPDQVQVIVPDPWAIGIGGQLNGQINLALQDESGNSESTELDVETSRIGVQVYSSTERRAYSVIGSRHTCLEWALPPSAVRPRTSGSRGSVCVFL